MFSSYVLTDYLCFLGEAAVEEAAQGGLDLGGGGGLVASGDGHR